MATAIAMASYEVMEGPREMGNGIWIRFSVRRQRGGLIFGCTNLVWAEIQKGRKFRAISKKTGPRRETGFSVFSENSCREIFPWGAAPHRLLAQGLRLAHGVAPPGPTHHLRPQVAEQHAAGQLLPPYQLSPPLLDAPCLAPIHHYC